MVGGLLGFHQTVTSLESSARSELNLCGESVLLLKSFLSRLAGIRHHSRPKPQVLLSQHQEEISRGKLSPSKSPTCNSPYSLPIGQNPRWQQGVLEPLNAAGLGWWGARGELGGPPGMKGCWPVTHPLFPPFPPASFFHSYQYFD